MTASRSRLVPWWAGSPRLGIGPPSVHTLEMPPARAALAVTLVTSVACGRVGFDTVDPEADAGGPPGMDASVDARAAIDGGVDRDGFSPPLDAAFPVDTGVAFDAGSEPDAGVRIDAGPSDAGPVAGSSLVGHWTMDDDPTDGSSVDHSATGNAAMCPPTDGCPLAAPGLFGNAIQLTGVSGGYLVVPYVSAYSTTSGFTVSVWVNMAWQRASIVAKLYDDPTSGWRNSWQIETEADGRVSFTVATGTSHSYGWTTTTFAADTWTHLAGTWDGTTRRLYIDGTSAFEMVEPVVFDNSDLWFGADYNASRTLSMVGLIDEVRVYDRALTPAEIGELARRPGGS